MSQKVSAEEVEEIREAFKKVGEYKCLCVCVCVKCRHQAVINKTFRFEVGCTS